MCTKKFFFGKKISFLLKKNTHPYVQHFNSKSKSQSMMIRGKAIEEALRFYIKNKETLNLRQKDIIDYAFDYYFLRTSKLSNQIAKKNSNSIPQLVRSGVYFFDNILSKNSILLNSSLSDGKIDIYPDFALTNIKFNDQLIKKCLIELKIVSESNFKVDSRYKRQALKYAYWSNLPVLLAYLVIKEKKSLNTVIFESYPRIISFF